jgi:CTP synthase
VSGQHPSLSLRRQDTFRESESLFCNVKPDSVIEAMDASTIYEVPLLMLEEKLDLICLKK